MKKNKKTWLFLLGGLAMLLALQVGQTIMYNRRAAAFPDDSIVGQGKPVLVEIGAANCIHCRRMLPVMNKLAEQQAEAFSIALVSLDKQPDSQSKYDVQGIPVQIFYDGQGNELYRHTGYLSKEKILNRWRQFGVVEE